MTRAPVALLLVILSCSKKDPGVELPPEPPRNVVLITLDTTRADRLGFMGYEKARTPNLDALAARGAVFTQARTCVPLTLPSHASIMTGIQPPAHGLRVNGIASLGESAHTLAETARDAGARTGGFVSAFVLDDQFGLDQGFDVYDDVPIRRLFAGGYIEERPADETVGAAIDWLGDGEGPFFMWVHLFDPHAPYDAPGAAEGLSQSDAYDAEIEFCDAQLGRLFDRLAELAELEGLEEPVICVTADHGEALGEHGEASHGVFVYDSTLRVPMVFAGPGVPAGEVSAALASVIDVAPTISELAGLPPLPDVHGIDLFGGAPQPRSIWFESLSGWVDHRWSPLIGVTNGTDKLIDAPRPELFDVISDPRELDDRSTREGDKLARMQRAVRAAAVALAREDRPARERSLNDEERRTLEQLGYTAGDEGRVSDAPFPSPELPDPKDRVGADVAKNQALALMSRHHEGGDVRLLDRAIGLLTRALVDDPAAAPLYELLGICHVRRSEFEDGIERLKSCLALRSDRVHARHALAVAYLGLGRVDEGRRELRRCLADQPTFVLGARTLAMHLHDAKEYEAAADAWRHFLRYWDVEDEEAQRARRGLAKALAKIAEGQ